MNLSTPLPDVPLWLVIYGTPLLLFLLYYFSRSWRTHKTSRGVLAEAVEAGLTEPASLHPLIDESKCLGCGTCVTACPESNKHVLGLIAGKSQLINPTHCIGHGACKLACPFDAITLVFGTEKRGMDIPDVKENYETNIPGMFIAGELGGMGLIRNAIRQGSLAMDSISKLDGLRGKHDLDVVIVGAGPAGMAATLGAMKHKLSHVTVDQDSFGGTVFNFPRGKIVMTAPGELPIIGKFHFRETTKEKLLEFWNEVKQKTGLKVQTGERVDSIEPSHGGFKVVTSKATYQTRAVLLTIGRRGTPRKLGVSGEELPKVVYRLIDPAQYKQQKVLIVGGGDSALEAAISIAEEPGTKVTISYRSESFGRAKQKNRDKIDLMASENRMQLLMKSNVKEITAGTVILDHDGEKVEIPNDAVIVNAGGILPTPFLKSIGIDVQTKFGTV
jgi:thioredoxin reductase